MKISLLCTLFTSRLRIFYGLLGVLLVACSHAQARLKEPPDRQVIHLTTLDWPPFTSPKAFGGGMTTMILKKAFESQGYRLKVEFVNWDQAVAKAIQQESVGYFPEYYSNDLNKRCVFSNAIGSSLVGFAHKKNEPIKYQTVQDLKSYRGGVVAGYVNEENFDKAVARGRISSLSSQSDVENLQNLVADNVDLAVIDRRVMGYWLRNVKTLKPFSDTLEFHPAGLKEHGLYVCFTGPDAKKNAQTLNQGLQSIDPMGFGLEHDPMHKTLK